MTDTPTPASADVIEGTREGNLAVLPKRLPERERYDLALARQTLERVIVPPAEPAALALPDSPTTHKGSGS